MPSRKRNRQEVEAEDAVDQNTEITMLDRVRSTSEFAALMQFLFIFGKALKVPDISIEEFEHECVLPSASTKIAEIGLALLKNISSHRGLTLDLFDEYTRRQYTAKAPHRNPFGVEEEAAKFSNFDVFTKIRVLHQLTTWTFWNPDRMRDKFPDLHFDHQAADWRINPYGWDSDGRIYYLLDDDRLYRQTDPPIPEPIRKKAKAPAKGSRASKRRRLSRVVESTPETTEDEKTEINKVVATDHNDISYEENFEGRKWECIAISYEDFQGLIASIKKSRDPDERTLCKRLENEMMPFLNKKEEERQRQELRRQKELATLQMLAGAKRSSRLANKAEQQRETEIEQEAERKRLAELKMAQKEQEKQQQLEQDRESRMQTREQRLREREVKRILHEEELRKEEEQLARLAEEEANGGPAGRVAHRQLIADMEKRQKELQALQAEEDQWIFDCSVCGVHGQNLDDGTHSIACDRCNVWQHSACHGIAQEQAEHHDFQFVCKHCKQKAEKPVPSIKLNVAETVNGTHSSPTSTPAKEKKQRKPRTPKDPSKPHRNVKIIKKKDPKTTSQVSSPAKVKPPANSVAVTANGSSTITGSPTAIAGSRQQPVATSSQTGPSNNASATTNGFVHYQPSAVTKDQPSMHSSSQSGAVFHKPSFPSFPPPGSTTSASHVQNGAQPQIQKFDRHQSPVQSNGILSAHASFPSTPSQSGSTVPIQPYNAAAPSSQGAHQTHYPSSQGPPRTPSYAQSAAHTLSSPAQHLTAPSPTQHAPALGASESSIHGSSPGYSPTKHPSPPRPSPSTSHLATRDNPIKPPIALSPISRPNITLPPIKKSPPPPAFSRSDAFGVTNAAAAVPAADDKPVRADGSPQHRSEHQAPPAVIMQNVTSNGQS